MALDGKLPSTRGRACSKRILSSVNPSNMHCYLGADNKRTGEASGIELYIDAVTVVTEECCL